jgi:hypothetical protein
MSKIDWRYLQQAIIVFVLAVIVAVLMAITADRFRAAQKKDYDQSLATLQSTYRDYSGLVNDIDLLEQYRTLFIGYKSTGLVGDERRLSWIESLKRTNARIRLPLMKYQLRPQEKFERPGLTLKRGVELSSAPMLLNMDLLHEEDILTVFETLRLSIKNLFTVDSCVLSRKGAVGGTLDTQKANLSANCVIRWLTIDVK